MKSICTKICLTLCMLYVGLNVYALKPEREYKTMPEEYNMTYDKVKIPSTKGAVLNAWYFPCPTKSEAHKVVMFNTDGVGNMADDLEKVSRFLSNGYHVLIYDYRGFGESSDFDIKEDMYLYPEFVDDFDAVAKWIRDNKYRRFFAYGEGIGAGLAMGIGYNSKDFIRIAVDSPFSSFQDLQKKYKTVDGVDLKVPLAGYNKQYEPFWALDKPGTLVDRIQITVGELDKKFTKADAEKLKEKQKKLIEIRVIKGVEANGTFDADKDVFIKGITDFFNLGR